MDSNITRRQFLGASGLTAVVLATSSLQVLVASTDVGAGQDAERGAKENTTTPAGSGSYGDWRDVLKLSRSFVTTSTASRFKRRSPPLSSRANS